MREHSLTTFVVGSVLIRIIVTIITFVVMIFIVIVMSVVSEIVVVILLLLLFIVAVHGADIGFLEVVAVVLRLDVVVVMSKLPVRQQQ